jgi:hypothetical protein
MDAHELAEAAYRRAVEVCDRVLKELEDELRRYEDAAERQGTQELSQAGPVAVQRAVP